MNSFPEKQTFKQQEKQALKLQKKKKGEKIMLDSTRNQKNYQQIRANGTD